MDMCDSPKHRNAPFKERESTAVLHGAWARSRATFAELTDRLTDSLHPAIRTVILSGSIGRMEQLPNSDCDLMVILNDDDLQDTRLAAEAFQVVWDIVSGAELGQPEFDGIFSTPSSQAELCDESTLGHIDEDMFVFGKRFQILLDSQPVIGDQAFDELLQAILRRYAKGDVARDDSKEWMFLLNDLVRYFRSLGIRYQYFYLEKPEYWRVINLKYKHSRFLIYAGLLLLIGECSRHQNKIEWLSERLRLTALERIAHVFESYDDKGFETIAGHYNEFLSTMSDERFRADLASPHPGHPSEHPAYSTLDHTAAGLRREVTRFVLDRRGQWSDRFMELLIF
jgi:predicted nucleotidyltransferase